MCSWQTESFKVNVSTVMDLGATQCMGSQSQQPILLQQPPFEVIGKQVFRRSGRGCETQYLISFIGCVCFFPSWTLPAWVFTWKAHSFHIACLNV